jgi:acetyltransferase-like isoleucine patch superfamily enzyme
MQTSLGGCWSSKIRTWIWGNVKVSKDVFVDEGVLIEASKEVTLGDNVVIGPRTMILNTEYGLDLHEHLESVAVSRGVRIGPGALICPGAQIEEDSIVCPGAVVYGDVPAGKIVSGNPAEILGNVEKAQGRSVLRRKRNHNFSASFWDRFDHKTFKERLGSRGAVSRDEEPEKRTFERMSKTVKIGYDVLAEGEGDIIVGKNVIIGHRVTICTTEHSIARSPIGMGSTVYPTIIEDNARIEPGSIILPGIRIGKNALVKAGSVVTRNVPAQTEVSGNPAQPLKNGKENNDRLEPTISRDSSKLTDQETRKFADILQLYKSYVEKTYRVKTEEHQLVFINRDVFFSDPKHVTFKGQALIAPRSILSSNYGFQGPTDFAEISVGDDVWIGAGAIVLSGVKLGKGSVVGAGAVVNEDVHENVVVLGNPAKSYKQRIVSDAVDLGRLLSFADELASPSKRLVNALKVGMIRLICR